MTRCRKFVEFRNSAQSLPTDARKASSPSIEEEEGAKQKEECLLQVQEEEGNTLI